MLTLKSQKDLIRNTNKCPQIQNRNVGLETDLLFKLKSVLYHVVYTELQQF